MSAFMHSGRGVKKRDGPIRFFCRAAIEEPERGIVHTDREEEAALRCRVHFCWRSGIATLCIFLGRRRFGRACAVKARLDPMEIEKRVRDYDRASHAALVSGHRLCKQLGKISRTRCVLGNNILMSMCGRALSVINVSHGDHEC